REVLAERLRHRRQHRGLRPDPLTDVPRKGRKDRKDKSFFAIFAGFARARNRMTQRATEVVEAEGHLIDSQLLNAMFDTVVRHDAAFDVLEFRIGRTNDEPSFVSMRVTAKAPAALTEVLEDLVALGCRVARTEDAHLTPA